MAVTTQYDDKSGGSQPALSNIILLSNSNGDQIELNKSTLNSWLTEIIDEKIIAKYGLRESFQVTSFLNTHAGKIVREMILEELIKIAKRDEFLTNHINSEQLAHQRLLAYLLIKVAHKEDEKFKQLCEETQTQINKILNANKKSSKHEYFDDPIFLLSLLENIEKYRQEIIESLEHKRLELTEIEQELRDFVIIRSSAQQIHRELGVSFHALRTAATDLMNYENLDQANTPSDLVDRLITLQTNADRADSHLTNIQLEIVEREGIVEPIIVESYSRLSQVRKIIKGLVAQHTSNNRDDYTPTTDKPLSPIKFNDLAKAILSSSTFFERSREAYINYYDTNYETLINKHDTVQQTIYHLESEDSKARKKADKLIKQITDKYPNLKELKSPKMSLSQPPAFFAIKDSTRSDSLTPHPEGKAQGNK